jgi:uncharacterized protein (DUF2141 family)
MRMALAIALLVLTQQRDAPVTPTGTSEISGIVLNADSQRLPLRRVVVSISGDQLPASRSAITDDAGRFVFARLPAGTYAITAKKAAYLPTEFGSPKPGRPGSRLALTAGEKRAITLTMFRGAAIGGTLRYPNGAPVSGVGVAALNVRMLGQRDRGESDPAITNDRGEYRIYGLMPGEYLVVASPAAGGTGETGARSASQMDALLATLTQRQARPNATSSLPSAPAVGYSPIYFPGTPLATEAEKIRLAPGDDRSTLNFEITRVPVASIEGTVTGDVPSLAAVQLSIIPELRDVRTLMGAGPGPGAGISITAVPPNDLGEFKYSNLSPGKYQIVARGRRGSSDPPPPPIPGGRGGARVGGSGALPVAGTGDMLYAVADVEIRGQDVRGVTLALQPGGAVSGNVVFDSGGAPAPVDLSRIRVAASVTGDNTYLILGGTRIGNMLSEVQPVNLKPDGTFQISGLGPSLYVLTCTLPNELAAVWKIRSAIVDGRDLLDTGVSGPFVQLRGVTVTLSDKRTEIAGSLLSGAGQPSADYYVIAFSADRANWRAGSRRNMSARPDTNGRFVFTDLPAGEYFIAALTDLDPAEWQDASFLEQVAPAAIKISLAEGERKHQDLRIK